jgi:hypothetical protein
LRSARISRAPAAQTLAAAILVMLGLAIPARAASGTKDQAPPAPPADSDPKTAADAPTVAARIDKTDVHVGDVVTLTVTAVGPSSLPVNLPAKVDLGPFELFEPDPREEDKDLGDGRMSRSFLLKIAAYEPGDLQVPGVEVTYLGKDGRVLSTHTAPLAVKVTSLIANEPEPKLKDPAPPVPVMEENLTLAYVAGGLFAAICGALIAIQVRKRMRERAAFRPPPPPRPAHEVALEKLDRLASTGFVEGADYRVFYFQLSEIVREYLGARFGFEALEMTTEELMAQLARRASRGLVLGEIAGWLSTSDLVKFAKMAPTAQEARGALETAIRLVESTRPRLEPQLAEVAPMEARVGGGVS